MGPTYSNERYVKVQEQQQPTPPQPLPRRTRRSSSQPEEVDPPSVQPRRVFKTRPQSELIKPANNTFFKVSKDRDDNDLFVLDTQDKCFSSGEEEEEEEKDEEGDGKEGQYVDFKPVVSSSYPGQIQKFHKLNLQQTAPTSECSLASATSEDIKEDKEDFRPPKDFVRKTQSLDIRRISASKFSLPIPFPRREKKTRLQSFEEKRADESKENAALENGIILVSIRQD